MEEFWWSSGAVSQDEFVFINVLATSSHVDLVHESKREQHSLPLAFLSLAFAAAWGGVWLSGGEN